MRNLRAHFNFGYQANPGAAGIARKIVVQYDANRADFSYFVPCPTGGREGMMQSKRFPSVFNGIVSGDSVVRTGLSNVAIGESFPVEYNQAAPNHASGKLQPDKLFTAGDRKVFMDALLNLCDARDGVVDGHKLRSREGG